MNPVAQTPAGPPESKSSSNPMRRTTKGGIRSGRTNAQKYTAVNARSGAGKSPPETEIGRFTSITSSTAENAGSRALNRRRMFTETGSATLNGPPQLQKAAQNPSPAAQVWTIPLHSGPHSQPARPPAPEPARAQPGAAEPARAVPLAARAVGPASSAQAGSIQVSREEPAERPGPSAQGWSIPSRSVLNDPRRPSGQAQPARSFREEAEEEHNIRAHERNRRPSPRRAQLSAALRPSQPRQRGHRPAASRHRRWTERDLPAQPSRRRGQAREPAPAYCRPRESHDAGTIRSPPARGCLDP